MRSTHCLQLSRLFSSSAILIAFLSLGLRHVQANEVPSRLSEALANKVSGYVDSHSGDVGVAVRIFGKDDVLLADYRHQPGKPMPTASLIKIAIMVDAYCRAETGELDLNRRVELTEEDKVPGSGILTNHFSPGAQLSLTDLIRLMMRYSDNTATNMVIDALGIESVNKRMQQLDYPNTQIYAKVFRRDTSVSLEKSKQFGLGSTTASEMLDLISMIRRRKIAGEVNSDIMLEHLESCDDELKLPRFLPAGTKIAHKTGSVTRSRTAAGTIWFDGGCIELAVLTNENEDASWSKKNAGDLLCSNIAKAAYDFAIQISKATEEESPIGSSPQILAQGAHGDVVEGLQRTLNARIDAELSIDGDFGPATAAAVALFQKSVGLDISSKVDQDTWSALGPIVPERPVPDPASVNESRHATKPWWKRGSPPETNAKAWTILDLQTGQFLKKNGDARLPNASTTKLMTALLVAELCDKEPERLQSEIEFSSRADKTIGSTAGIRTGEIVPVKELLYGLLLPSGNDASVAFAEEFGREAYEAVTNTKVKTEVTPAIAYELFVEAMNSRAEQLGMKNTMYANPHGLTQEGHYSSSVDLAMLGNRVLKHPLLSKIVATPERGCRVESRLGYSRNVLWKNTNRLLEYSEFNGLKTGTTSAAGACLVAASDRDGQEHIVVVLGCPTSSSRYTDAKNLLNWIWSKDE
ncbi:MAG: serine hydrolase [Aureliella sp.]